jgi:FdrA protein
MAIHARLKRKTYHDSITLMTIAQVMKDQAGVEDAGAVMMTEMNRELLANAGLLPEDFLAQQEPAVETDDLLMVVRAGGEAQARGALEAAEARLSSRVQQGTQSDAGLPAAYSLEAALRQDKEANLAVISVAGEHAWLEVEQALRHGLHVFLFSDNVPIEQELRLKTLAVERGLLLMGPDCGTAIINGVGLGFSNVVKRGSIGIVGASGTGMQEITCLIAAAGQGISQAIGTGGRDLSEAIGGIMMSSGLALLNDDPQTEVIVLVSKPPAENVAHKLLSSTTFTKPVVVVFLNTAPERFNAIVTGTGNANNIHFARTLTEGAAAAVALAKGEQASVAVAQIPPAYEARMADERASLAAPQRYVRALYSGGTLCDEAMLLLSEQIGAITSNIPLKPEWALPADKTFHQHTALDLGSDEFTRGRPHPMIDATTRLQYIALAAADAETAVILLDIVLGFCSHENPAAVYGPAIVQARTRAVQAGRTLPIIVSLCGTEGDPQRLSLQRITLEAAGALVFESNAAAALATATFIRDTNDTNAQGHNSIQIEERHHA